MAYEFQEWPKWIGDKLVNSAAEEAALKPKVPEDDEVPHARDTFLRRGPGRPPNVK